MIFKNKLFIILCIKKLYAYAIVIWEVLSLACFYWYYYRWHYRAHVYLFKFSVSFMLLPLGEIMMNINTATNSNRKTNKYVGASILLRWLITSKLCDDGNLPVHQLASCREVTRKALLSVLHRQLNTACIALHWHSSTGRLPPARTADEYPWALSNWLQMSLEWTRLANTAPRALNKA